MTKQSKADSVARESASLPEDQLACLRSCFPEVFTEGKVDMEKLRDSLGDVTDSTPERYSFTWAGKKDAIRILQSPSRATLLPSRDESVVFDSTDNLFIEGDNLEVLKLLYKPYFGCVKMIYIDPPYNTGNDFVYPDNYTDPLATYLKLSGQKDGNGNHLTSNPETNGRYHSAWLSMMYPRLFLARQLLREDGVIWISIDYHEEPNLRQICNEILGEENFVSDFIWEKRTTRENRKVFSVNHDYILCYARNKDAFQASRKLLPLTEEALQRYANPDNDPRGEWQSVSLNAQADARRRKEQFYEITTPGGRVVNPPSGRCWIYTRDRMDELIADNRVWFGEDGKNVPREKVFRSEAKEGLTPHTLWTAAEVGTTDTAKKELIELFDGMAVFDTPKPVPLLRRMVQISTSDNDIIVDFFAGTAATAHAVLQENKEDKGNRRFIMVQIPEPTPEDSVARKSGYKSIADIGKERIRRTLKQLDSKEGFKIFKLAESNYRPWTGVAERDAEALAKQMELMNDPLVENWTPESVLYEVAMKEAGYGLSVTAEHVADVKKQDVQRVTDPEREQSFYLCLDDKISLDALAPLKLTQDDLFICRDNALDDTTAANLALQCRLKTI